MEGNNPDEIPVEYADVYFTKVSDKEGSSSDDDNDSNKSLHYR